MQSIIIDTIESLKQTLEKYNVDHTKMDGTNGSKKLDSLFQEIVKGECFLIDLEGKIQRTVRVLYVLLKNDNKILMEAKQYDHKLNRERVRGVPLAEKLLPSEDITFALTRAIDEELGLNPEGYSLSDVTTHTVIETKFSPSYPGLESSYNTEYVNAKVKFSSDKYYSDFDHTEMFEDNTPRLKTYWTWTSIENLPKNILTNAKKD